MKKHAYLILAHDEFGLLSKLICLLDYPENDIYIHIDKSVRNFSPEIFHKIVKHAEIHFIPSRKISWAGHSIARAELDLLREAVKSPHSYYHMLSGVDLPIKSHDEIVAFFNKNDGMEFIEIDRDELEKNLLSYKIRYYHFFQEQTAKGVSHYQKFFQKLGFISRKLQIALGIDRIKADGITPYKGATWFSITHNLAVYVLAQESRINKRYRFTISSNEFIFQTLAMNSHFKHAVAENSLRYIDWDRGNPYTFTLDDYETLINSNCLWARKFSETKDAAIVEKIFRTYINTLPET